MNKKNIWNLSVIKDQKEKEADAFACKKILALAGGCGDIRAILRYNGVPRDVINHFLDNKTDIE